MDFQGWKSDAIQCCKSRNIDFKIITKPWQLSGIKPMVREGAVNLSNKVPIWLDDTRISGLSNSIGKLRASSLFYVERDRRITVLRPSTGENTCTYPVFVKSVFEAYTLKYVPKYLCMFNMKAAQELREVGLIVIISLTPIEGRVHDLGDDWENSHIECTNNTNVLDSVNAPRF